jgi:hypothetical protein
MESLKDALGTVKLPQLNRERLIEFGRKRAKQGAGPATLAIDLSFIRTIVSHAAAVHGAEVSAEEVRRRRTLPAPRARSGAMPALRRPAALLDRRSVHQKIVQLIARFKLRRDPAGLFPTAGPGLAWILWILILLKDRRVRATLAIQTDNVAEQFNLTQPLLEPGFFRRRFLAQFGGYRLMNIP